MKLLSTILIMFILAACAGGYHRPSKEAQSMNEKLVTTITPNGLKLFTFTISQSNLGGDREERIRKGDKPNRGSSSKGHGNNGIKSEIEARLLSKLNNTEFCREGYIELGSSIDKRESFIRGECVEAASNNDLELFSRNGKY